MEAALTQDQRLVGRIVGGVYLRGGLSQFSFTNAVPMVGRVGGYSFPSLGVLAQPGIVTNIPVQGRSLGLAIPSQADLVTNVDPVPSGSNLVINFMQTGGARSTNVPSDNMAPCSVSADIADSVGWDRRWMAFWNWGDTGGFIISNEMMSLGGFPTNLVALRSNTHDASDDQMGSSSGYVYMTNGTYSCSVTVYTHTGEVFTNTWSVEVTTNVRSNIYVSAAGNDGNDGTTPTNAVLTAAQAESMMGNGSQVLFRRGDVFTNALNASVINVTPSESNVILRDFGTNATAPHLQINRPSGSGREFCIDAQFGPSRFGAINLVCRGTAGVLGDDGSVNREFGVGIDEVGGGANSRNFLVDVECLSEGTGHGFSNVGLLLFGRVNGALGLTVMRGGTHIANGGVGGTRSGFFSMGNACRHSTFIGFRFGACTGEHQHRYLSGGSFNLLPSRFSSYQWITLDGDVSNCDDMGRGFRLETVSTVSMYQSAIAGPSLETAFDSLRTSNGWHTLIEGMAQRTGGDWYTSGRIYTVGANARHQTFRNNISILEDDGQFFIGRASDAIQAVVDPLVTNDFRVTDVEVVANTIIPLRDTFGAGAPGTMFGVGNFNEFEGWGYDHTGGSHRDHYGLIVTNFRVTHCLFCHQNSGETEAFTVGWQLGGQSNATPAFNMPYPDHLPRLNGTSNGPASLSFGTNRYNVWPTATGYSSEFIAATNGSTFTNYVSNLAGHSQSEINEDHVADTIISNSMLPAVGTIARTNAVPEQTIVFDWRGVMREQNTNSWPVGAIGLETP